MVEFYHQKVFKKLKNSMSKNELVELRKLAQLFKILSLFFKYYFYI